MDERAAALIRSLKLERHPEGGYFREMFRSREDVRVEDGRGVRSAVTSIYYLLGGDDFGRWHVVGSDEVWHFYEGAPVELFTVTFEDMAEELLLLGPLEGEQRPQHVVPAGTWQAARSTGAYSLVGCTVGPGFDFSDFELLRDNPDARAMFEKRVPDWVSMI